jgi:amino acid permease
MPSRSTYFLLAVGGIAFLTRPTKSSLRRVVDASAQKEAGGGVVGWAAGKAAQAIFHAALAGGGYSISNLGFALVVTPTKELAGTEAESICFIGLFGVWFCVNTSTGQVVCMRDEE